MIAIEFTTGKKPSYYEVEVGIPNCTANYKLGIYSKASFDAVASALRASVPSHYLVTVTPIKMLHSEYESLDTACAILSRLRFVEYTTKDVEKVVIVKETVRKEL